jgi:hypothetical protein
MVGSQWPFLNIHNPRPALQPRHGGVASISVAAIKCSVRGSLTEIVEIIDAKY